MARPLTARELRELQAYLQIWNSEFQMGSSQRTTADVYNNWVSHNLLHLRLQGLATPPPFTTNHLSRVQTLLPYSTRFEGEGESERENHNYIRQRALAEYNQNVLERILRPGGLDEPLSPHEIALAEASAMILARQHGLRDFTVRGENAPPFPANVLQLIREPGIEPVLFPPIRGARPGEDGFLTRTRIDSRMTEVLRDLVFEHNVGTLNMSQKVLLEFTLDTVSRNYMPSPIGRIDGVFAERRPDEDRIDAEQRAQRNMLNSIGYVLSDPNTQRRLRELGEVIHERPVVERAPLTSLMTRRDNALGGTGTEGHRGLDYGENRFGDFRMPTTVNSSSTENRIRAWGYHEQFGNFVILEDRNGLVSLYGHMAQPFRNYGSTFESQEDIVRDITFSDSGTHVYTVVNLTDDVGLKQYIVDNSNFEDLGPISISGNLGLMGSTGRSSATHLHLGMGRNLNMDDLRRGIINIDWIVPVVAVTPEHARLMDLAARYPEESSIAIPSVDPIRDDVNYPLPNRDRSQRTH